MTTPSRPQWEMHRRSALMAMGASLFGSSASGWLPSLAQAVANEPNRKRQCILLWMPGGPSQLDTFDMKPGHANGGSFKPISTSVAGIKISEHLPMLAKQADRLAIMRGLSTKEGDHGRGTYLMRTGQTPTGAVRYPSIGASLSKELGDEKLDVPNYVSISPYRIFNQSAFGPGFLGPRFAPLTVGASDALPMQQPTPAQQAEDEAYAVLRVDDLKRPTSVSAGQQENRKQLWTSLQKRFLTNYSSRGPTAHDTVYRRALRMMESDAAKAFDLDKEPDAVRAAYGKGRFGQGCLMARRLIEQGVAFVEVSLGDFGGGAAGWDTHQNNFEQVKNLSAQLDKAWSTLMKELSERGLLESTTIIWMGEFGRTPQINDMGGRDHFPTAWSAVLAGGGIRGGTVHGKTNESGMEVVDGKIHQGDLLATLTTALGVPPTKQNISGAGRPIAIAEGTPVDTVLADA